LGLNPAAISVPAQKNTTWADGFRLRTVRQLTRDRARKAVSLFPELRNHQLLRDASACQIGAGGASNMLNSWRNPCSQLTPTLTTSFHWGKIFRATKPRGVAGTRVRYKLTARDQLHKIRLLQRATRIEKFLTRFTQVLLLVLTIRRSPPAQQHTAVGIRRKYLLPDYPYGSPNAGFLHIPNGSA